MRRVPVLEFALLETGRSVLSPSTGERCLPGHREGQAVISKEPLLHHVHGRQELGAGVFPEKGGWLVST